MYSPTTQTDGIGIWRESLAKLQELREVGADLPLIMCCGPSEQADKLQEELVRDAIITQYYIPHEHPTELSDLRMWYTQRTGKEAPKTEDNNLLLVQLFFEWRVERTLPVFAGRFLRRLRATDSALAEVVVKIVALNRFYVGMPTEALNSCLNPAQQDQFIRLTSEEHLQIDKKRPGVWLAHPHLANALYEHWYPQALHTRNIRESHLIAAINDCLDFSTVPRERMAPIWALTRAIAKTSPDISDRIEAPLAEQLLAYIYHSRFGDIAEFSEFPAWIEFYSVAKEIKLTPNPCTNALQSLTASNALEPGFRLTCHKLLQHAWNLEESIRCRIVDSVLCLLSDTISGWKEWHPIALHAVQIIEDERLWTLISTWARDNASHHGTGRLLKHALTASNNHEKVLIVAEKLLQTAHAEFAWGDIAILLLPTDGSKVISQAVRDWANNNCTHFTSVFLLSRLLEQGVEGSRDWAIKWAEQWHKERLANFILEMLCRVNDSHNLLRDWCCTWLSLNYPEGSFLLQMILRAYYDETTHELALLWLQANHMDPGWPFVWEDLNKLSPGDSVLADLHDAEVSLLRVKAERTRSPNDWALLSVYYGKAGNFEAAIDTSICALKIDPSSLEARKSLAINLAQLSADKQLYYLEQTASSTSQAGDWQKLALFLLKAAKLEDASNAARQALSIDAESKSSLRILLGCLRRLGITSKNIEEFRTLVEKENSFPSWIIIGSAYERLGLHDLAIKAAEAALEADNNKTYNRQRLLSILGILELQSAMPILDHIATKSNKAEDWEVLIASYLKIFEPKKAVTAAKQYLATNPNAHNVRRGLAAALGHCGKNKDSIEQLELLSNRTGLASDWNLLSMAYGKEEIFDLALYAAKKALDIEPNNIDARRSYSINLSRTGNAEDSMEELRSVALQSGLASDWNLLSMIYGKSSLYSLALDSSLEALRIDPDNIDARRSSAVNLGHLGQHEQSIETLKELVARTSLSSDWVMLSLSYGKASLHELAASAAQEALLLDPDNTDALRSLAVNLGHLGKARDSVEILRDLTRKAGLFNDWYLLSINSSKANLSEESAHAARIALSFSPKEIEIRRNLAINIGYVDPDEGINILLRIVQETSACADWHSLALAYFRSAQYKKALLCARTAIAIDESHVDGWKDLFLAAEQLRLSEELHTALAKLDELTKGMYIAVNENAILQELKENPESESNWLLIANLYSRQNRHKDLAIVTKNVVNDHPEASRHVLPVVNSLINLYPLLALEILELLTKIDCMNPEFSHLTGITRRKIGDLQGALYACTAAVNQAPHIAYYWYGLGKVLEALDDRDKAINAYLETVRLNPKHMKARRKLKEFGCNVDEGPEKGNEVPL